MVRAEIDTALFARFSALNEQLPVIEVVNKPANAPVALDSKTTIELAKLRTQIKNWKNSFRFVKMLENVPNWKN